MGAPPGFAARRPNAPSLPNFELPPPIGNGQPKYNFNTGYTQGQQPPSSLASVGNLLTPPSTVSGDGVSSNPGAAPSYGQNPGYAWSPAQNNSAYGYSHQQRVPYSPLNSASGQPTSEAQMSSSYPVSLPPFPSSAPMSAPHDARDDGAAAATPRPRHDERAARLLGRSGHQPLASAGPGRVPAAADTYILLAAAKHAAAVALPLLQRRLATQATPLSAGPMSGRPQMSPASAGPHPPLSAPPIPSAHAYQARMPPYHHQGPVLSNINNPNGQPMMLNGLQHAMMPGGFNGGHPAGLQHMYGAPHAQTPPHNDRPFKCDQCPQSFKPQPRPEAAQAHSLGSQAVPLRPLRQELLPQRRAQGMFATRLGRVGQKLTNPLQRHILVKGCGKAQQTPTATSRTAPRRRPPKSGRRTTTRSRRPAPPTRERRPTRLCLDCSSAARRHHRREPFNRPTTQTSSFFFFPLISPLYPRGLYHYLLSSPALPLATLECQSRGSSRVGLFYAAV